MTHIVILGAGFGGLNAAKKLANQPGVQVTLIDKTNHHLFQPLLYQVATAGLNPAEIATPVRSILRNAKNVTILMDEIMDLDFANRKVTCKKNTLTYDYLIVAMGSESHYYGNDAWKKYTLPLKSLTDALTIRERLLCSLEMAEMEKDPETKKALLTSVIIGGGPTGVEVAGAIAELKKSILEKEFKNLNKEDLSIILIEGSPHLLNGFHPTLRQYAREQLQKMGVSVMTESMVKNITENCVHLENRKIKTANIIWAAGVRGNRLFAGKNIKQSPDGRIVVDERFRLPDFPEVYVIGDLAWYQYPHTFNGQPLPALSPVAIQSGKFVAKDILRQLQNKSPKTFYYRYKGIMSTIGRSAAVVQFPWFRMKGWLAWVIWVFVHIMYLVDFQNRVIVFLRWVWFYLTWKRGSRLITRIFELTLSDKKCH